MFRLAPICASEAAETLANSALNITIFCPYCIFVCVYMTVLIVDVCLTCVRMTRLQCHGWAPFVFTICIWTFAYGDLFCVH